MEGIPGISAIEKAPWKYSTHFTTMFHFRTLWNHYKARFSMDIEMEHWREIG